jgi:hypothetical protein
LQGLIEDEELIEREHDRATGQATITGEQAGELGRFMLWLSSTEPKY